MAQITLDLEAFPSEALLHVAEGILHAGPGMRTGRAQHDARLQVKAIINEIERRAFAPDTSELRERVEYWESHTAKETFIRDWRRPGGFEGGRKNSLGRA